MCTGAAQLVSERDKGIRAAALGTLEALHAGEGAVAAWRAIGPVSDQQRSLIEERFRHADKQAARAAAAARAGAGASAGSSARSTEDGEAPAPAAWCRPILAARHGAAPPVSACRRSPRQAALDGGAGWPGRARDATGNARQLLSGAGAATPAAPSLDVVKKP
jgi:hypothetical protein